MSLCERVRSEAYQRRAVTTPLSFRLLAFSLFRFHSCTPTSVHPQAAGLTLTVARRMLPLPRRLSLRLPLPPVPSSAIRRVVVVVAILPRVLAIRLAVGSPRPTSLVTARLLAGLAHGSPLLCRSPRHRVGSNA